MPTSSPPLPRVRAPRLPADPGRWRGTPPAAGSVVLLDFFTGGCINCRHVLCDLARLEARHAGRPFAVVGVHSPKFDAEKGDAAVRDAVRRLGVRHPVVRDDDHALRRAYAVRAWPTLVLVDGRGYEVGRWSGEGHADAIEAAVCAALAGETDPPERDAPAPLPDAVSSPLRFPGRVLAADGRLFVADTGDGRVIAMPTDADGPCRVYGVGELRAPQGLALSPDGGTLFIADADDQRIRAVDLASGEVRTVAGTGRRRIGALSPGPVPARDADLNSPWDLAPSPDGRTLFVAMAGAHQIAGLDLAAGTLRVLAGSGREARRDGDAPDASFAQPSGITLSADGRALFVADAESSSVRVVDTATGATATRIAGDLFDWGDADGPAESARLQHPEGVALATGGTLFIADTFNGKVKALTPDGVLRTIAAGLARPTGVSVAPDGTLFVAESAAHRVLRLDPITGASAPIPFPGLDAPPCVGGVCAVPDAVREPPAKL